MYDDLEKARIRLETVNRLISILDEERRDIDIRLTKELDKLKTEKRICEDTIYLSSLCDH